VNDGAARAALKRLLGALPLAAEASQWLKPGHATPIDQPEEFNRLVLEFLRE